jgi:UDP-N-acetylglucosamine diphosphorylase / glucose-1-phosphate thymidylyltransferase / UDP-N-acetylgalactosamine diphosphorylase / glucosamine-1-phosphate N-acetyltransferase / galactosamine-1-phosphate N-acetyltransferase
LGLDCNSLSFREGRANLDFFEYHREKTSSMKAVILAAGKGTRMRELTREIPKPMLQVQGRPILEHIIQGLQSSGLREICIITGYRSEMVEAYFRDGSQLGVKISYARQETQDGTGKAPELARDFVGTEDFLLSYGDILVKPETYGKMQQRFGEGNFAGLVTVTPGQDVSQGGLNFFDEEFCLKKVVEKPSREQVERYRNEGLIQPGEPVWYNAGIHIFRPVLFEFTEILQKSSRGEYELPDALNGMVLQGLKIAGLEVEGRWVDVRDPEVLAALERESQEDIP